MAREMIGSTMNLDQLVDEINDWILNAFLIMTRA